MLQMWKKGHYRNECPELKDKEKKDGEKKELKSDEKASASVASKDIEDIAW